MALNPTIAAIDQSIPQPERSAPCRENAGPLESLSNSIAPRDLQVGIKAVLEWRSHELGDAAIDAILPAEWWLNSDAIQRLCQALNTSEERIMTLGKACANANVLDICLGSFEFGRVSFKSWLYPAFESNQWRAVDGTMVHLRDDQEHRYRRGPAYSNNSCAFDCMMFVGQQLEIGRSAIEQLGSKGMSLLPHHHILARLILAGPLEAMGSKDYQSLLMLLRKQLECYRSTDFGFGKMASVQVLLEYLFKGSPTFSWHWIRLDGDFLAVGKEKRREVELASFLSVNSRRQDGFPAQLQDLFRAGEPGESSSSLHNVDGEKSQSYRFRCVLDRLPPVLQVITERWDIDGRLQKKQLQKLKAFDPVTITYQTPRGPVTATYVMEGIITSSDKHFVVWWKPSAAASLVRYDGLKRDGRVENTAIDSFYEIDWKTYAPEALFLVVK